MKEFFDSFKSWVTQFNTTDEEMEAVKALGKQEVKYLNNPLHPEKYWQYPEFNADFLKHYRLGGLQGKESHYLFDGEHRANSYSTVLRFYDKAEKTYQEELEKKRSII